jgi:hypothetical protein
MWLCCCAVSCPTEKKKKKPNKGDFIISGPTAPAQHVVHVDKNWNWSSMNGEEGHTQFDAGVKLGQGYVLAPHPESTMQLASDVPIRHTCGTNVRSQSVWRCVQGNPHCVRRHLGHQAVSQSGTYMCSRVSGHLRVLTMTHLHINHIRVRPKSRSKRKSTS